MALRLLKPPPLRPGDSVAIVAPADRPHSPGEAQRATALLEQLGFTPHLFLNSQGRHSAWADPDHERAATFMRPWYDERVRAIWLLRGGWGAARLLPLLDYPAIATHPKILIANDEASSLLIAIHQRTGLATLHGPELARCKLDTLTRTWLLQLLTNPAAPGAVPHLPVDPFDYTTAPLTCASGRAEGQLIGGQLTELASLLATPDAPQVADKLLFVALPSYAPYVLERHLTALRLAGLPQQSAGMILSDTPGAPDPRTPVTLTLEEALRYGLKNVERPCCIGLPIGAALSTAALPLGIHATLDADTCTLTLNEGMVAP